MLGVHCICSFNIVFTHGDLLVTGAACGHRTEPEQRPAPGQNEYRVADHGGPLALLGNGAAVVICRPPLQQLLQGGVVPEAAAELVCRIPTRPRAAIGDLHAAAEQLASSVPLFAC
jgi:hypothetical protein